MAKSKSIASLYKTAYKTVQKRVSKLESQGYVFDVNKLPKMRKQPTKKGIEHLKKFTESYLKNMPSTKFRVGANEYVSGARGAHIQASSRAKKGVSTRHIKRGDINERFDDTIYRDAEPSFVAMAEEDEDVKKQDALAEAINEKKSNDYFFVESDGTVIDVETSEIVYESHFNKTMVGGSAIRGVGESLVDGLDNLIEDYEVSDNRWVREKAQNLRKSFQLADLETLADNLAHMPSDFISYVQQVIEESGGNQADVNNNYAKLVEIQALIEGRTLEMGSLRNDFAD